MRYQVGDMLKVCTNNGEAFCVIVEQRDDNAYKVFWLIEKGNIRNSPGYQYWSDFILDKEFVRLS